MKSYNQISPYKSSASDKPLFMEDAVINKLQEKTGKTLDEWIAIVKNSGLEKHKEIIEFLKTKHGLTFVYANLITQRAQGSDANSAENSADALKAKSKTSGTRRPETGGFRTPIRQKKTG